MYYAVYPVVICFTLHILPMIIFPFYLYAVKPSVYCTSCCVLASDPCANWDSLILLMIIRTWYLYAVYSVVLWTLCSVLALGPCLNCTVWLIVIWELILAPSSSLRSSYLLTYVFFYRHACIRHMPKRHSLPCGFLNDCSCAFIKHYPKLHTVPCGY